jgi:hypothetical protein
MIRELPVKPVVPALETLPVNVLLAIGEHMVAGKRQPLFDRTKAAAALLDWPRTRAVLTPHIWAPSPDAPRRAVRARARKVSARDLADDLVRTPRFLGLKRDGGKPNDASRYDIVHCVSHIGRNYDGDPLMFLGVDLTLSPGMLRDALVRCGTRLLILQSLGYHHRGDCTEQLAEFVAGAGGPAVLVVPDDETRKAEAYMRDLYARILRNQPIEDAAGGTGPDTLFAYGTGGERLLRFESMIERLDQQLRDYSGLVDGLLYELDKSGRAVASADDLESLRSLHLRIGRARSELESARESVGAHAKNGSSLLAGVATDVARIKEEIGHHPGEGALHTKFDMLAYRLGESRRERERVAPDSPRETGRPRRRRVGSIRFKDTAPPQADVAESATPLAATSLVPATERQINIWIGESDQGFEEVLKIGETYRLNFRVGQPVRGSLTSGDAAKVSASDVPKGGLPVDWLVVAHGAELAGGTPDTAVSVVNIEATPTWSGRFKLLIPEDGDSATPQLRIRPLEAAPVLDVVITARKEQGYATYNEVYRQLRIELAASERPAAAPAEPLRIADDLMPTATAHVGLRTTHEWTTPRGILSVIVFGAQAAVQGVAGAEQVDSLESWTGVPALVSGKIKNVRDAAEELRATFERHFNNIDPIDLTDRLNRWKPEYNWSSLADHADPAHRQEWDRMAASPELRKLALYGRQLFHAFFGHDSNLHKWIAALEPGARLNISWTPRAGPGFIPHVPWGLMYVADVPPDGRPIDPMGFLGLRCRLAYTAHVSAPASRSLGALAGTYRAHFLYWGEGPADPTGEEARWQRTQWGTWQNQIFVPQTVQNAKAELLNLLNNPQPSPTSVLYLFCQCNTGAGNNPILRFGSTNDPANVIIQTDFGTAAFADRPLVFANACTTVAADPYMANDLEDAFFERDCRAFIGTESKVPIVLASRFAEIFFRFFYRVLDPSPMAAGEALAQARLFLWTHYRNIGGLFYACVNQYDLFLAGEDEIVALRA